MHYPLRTVVCAVAMALATLTPLQAATTSQPAASQAASVPLPEGITRVRSVEGVNEYLLANGLRVLIAADPSKPKTTVNITYLVGSRHENYGETGMAHLLEHMLFKGTPTFPNGTLDREYSRRGIQSNATTWYDRTNYFEIFAASDDNLDWTLRMEADRMLNSLILKQDLDSEMTVVRNEMERGENDPDGVLVDKLTSAAFQWHNYGKSTIGARSDVENVGIDRLQAFYKLYYQPDNAVLAVTGQLDEAKTLQLIARYFGPLPKPSRKLPTLYTREPTQDGAQEVTLERVGDSQRVGVFYHVAPGSHADHAANALLDVILGDTPNGRLHKAVVEKGLASGSWSWGQGWADSGFQVFMLALDKRQSRDKAREVMLSVIEGIKQKPITEAELKLAKRMLLNDFEKTLNDQSRFTLELSEAIGTGDWRLSFLNRDRIEAATLADVQRAAEHYFKPSNRTVGHFVPTDKPNRAEIPKAPAMDSLLANYTGRNAVAQGEAFDPSPANIDSRVVRSQLKNGMKVALLQKATRGDTVSGRVNLHFGDEKSLAGKSMAAELTAAMLNRGAGGLSRSAISERLETLQSQLTFVQYDKGNLYIGFESRRQHLPAMLELVQTMLRKPTFAQTELAQLKQEWITGIEDQRRQPRAVAQLALERHDNPYPATDPRYVPTFEEQLAQVKQAQVSDLQKFHREFFGANHGEVALVGSFDQAAVQAQLEKLFGDWKSKVSYRRIEDPYHAATPKVLSAETPDKANAEYLAGLALPIRDDAPDFAALSVAVHILGGDGSSRLWQRLRERDGITYGAYARLEDNSKDANSTLNVTVSYAPENLAKLKTGMIETFETLRREGITEAELTQAKGALLQRNRLGRTQDSRLSGQLAYLLFLGRDMRFVADLEKRIEALTVAEVNEAVRRHLDPAKLVHSYAGDFAGSAKRTASAKP
ncbi:M16 family metallopeptidase [Chitinimonas lacunae]|uniref:M16 family metallopeptidase n=1 Tax=Chitinimonas lacunae TaxID=1963018 RepID=A0ABV8MRW6_9NEIS